MTRVLVTGANGFVGSALCPMLVSAGYQVRAALRGGRRAPHGTAECAIIEGIHAHTDWTEALSGVQVVIHLAARVHRTQRESRDEALYADTNANGTRALALAALGHGVRRFIYLSSVKVNGEGGPAAYSAHDPPRPQDAYARSKWRAEQYLWESVAGSPMQAAVVRSPLVYGPGVRANFLRLLRWIERERWLPLGAIRNRRSLISVWNLCDLLVRLLDHAAAGGRTWMVSDGEDLSTPELVRRIARAMSRRARLLPVPAAMLRLAGGALGQSAQVHRLCDSLTVDIKPTLEELGWSPPVPTDEALARTVSWYRAAGQPLE